jgi:hypothetical protein
VTAIPKPEKRPKRRGHRSPVTDELRAEVFARDGFRCLAPIIGDANTTDCRGPYGNWAVVTEWNGRKLYDLSALTIEHVHFQPMLGRRAVSDKEHCLTLCWLHNTQGWASMNKEREREYLRSLYGEIAA